MRFPFLAALCCFGLLTHANYGRAQQPPKDKPQPKETPQLNFSKDVVPFLEKYCTNCHGGPKPKGKLDLSKYKDETGAAQYKNVWDKVVANLRSGDMPPSGKAKPPLEQIEKITAWMEATLLAFDCTKQRDPGRVTFRRLNKNEYNNTIRDLLGVKFKPAEDFPSDDVGYGFDNIGDVLTMSPLLMEKYLAASEKIVDEVFKTPELRKKIMVVPEPGAKATPQQKEEAARAILGPFVNRAYRRTVYKEDLGRLFKFIALAEKNGDNFDKGIQLAMRAVLCSPYFLFRVEKDYRIKGEQFAFAISQFELAARLSYFLWSSMPDDELFKHAGDGTLKNPRILGEQIGRMLKDPKARALTENFAGQWLQLRSVAQLSPDPKLFPNFNDQLRMAMIKETELFFDAIVKENRSIFDFLDADYTFVNERLAKHYGISGIKGEEFRKVTLGSQRIGVLTHASILSVTSNPTRTSPVKRGKWILDNILNTPPPPPPPDAGELSEDAKVISSASLRVRMETHRKNPNCAVCHQRMDPLGFGFENFDAIGAWRTKDGKFDVDASGELPGGQRFTGPKELVKILKSKEAEFRRCLVEKMLTYALGRGLEYYDKCAVDDICAAMARDNNRFVTMMVAIAKCDPFQMRKGRP